MKNTFIVTSLSASAFLLSSFTSLSPHGNTGELAPYAATDRAQGYEVQVENTGNSSPEAPVVTYEILLETLQDTFDNLACLLNECNERNADAQAEKIEKETESMLAVRAVVRKIYAEHPEAKGDVDEEAWRAKLNAAHKNVVNATVNVFLQNFYGSDALKEAIKYLAPQLKN